MGEVIALPGLTTLPIPVERVIDGAKEMNYEEVVILGFNKEGKLIAAVSHPDKGRLLFITNLFTHKLLAGDYDDDT